MGFLGNIDVEMITAEHTMPKFYEKMKIRYWRAVASIFGLRGSQMLESCQSRKRSCPRVNVP
jgi:hypothetical protein